jgi:aromatic-L-amino-acid decarboxylase
MTPSERQLLLYQQLPEYGRSPEALFDFFEQHIQSHAMGNQHPRFAAWVNPAGAPIGMLAEFLSVVMNPSAAGGDHAAIYLEHCAVRWLMELIGFPVGGSMGILVGGGSVASLYCWRWLATGLRRLMAGICEQKACKAIIRRWCFTSQKVVTYAGTG